MELKKPVGSVDEQMIPDVAGRMLKKGKEQ